MDLSQLIDVDPGNEEELSEFLDSNAFAHESIFGALLTQGIVIAHYPLFSTGGDSLDWSTTHNAEHVAIRAALNLSGVADFSAVDLKDEESAAGFFDAHFQEHSLIALTLGL